MGKESVINIKGFYTPCRENLTFEDPKVYTNPLRKRNGITYINLSTELLFHSRGVK
jgi:hypothetical protein